MTCVSVPSSAHQDHGFVPVIGLEIHAQILSASKLFSGAPADVFNKAPNSCVSFVDAGLPGMLPVLNARCVEQGIRTGLGLKGRINLRSVFERKNYFYPDLPSGYQISQYLHPLMEDGHLVIGGGKTIRIQRLHLEQDAGKLVHDVHPLSSHVDLNRSGIGLMEIVSHPDMASPEEAVEYAQRLRAILRYLGTCDGNMDQGSLRIDANISVHKPGTPLGTRTEIKNINSFRFLHQALVYEIQRHIQCLLAGQPLIQETRGFDAKKGITMSLRKKEEAYDYRYFPDPDVPVVTLTQDLVDGLAASLPELPQEKARRFEEKLGLSPYDAQVVTEDPDIAAFFEEAVACLANPTGERIKSIANWIIGELFASLKKSAQGMSSLKVTPTALAQLVTVVAEGHLSSTLAKEVWGHMWHSGEDPLSIMEAKGLRQISDPGQIRQWVEEVLERESANVALYLSGQEKLMGYFVGQVMKLAKGKANPQLIQQALGEHLHGAA